MQDQFVPVSLSVRWPVHKICSSGASAPPRCHVAVVVRALCFVPSTVIFDGGFIIFASVVDVVRARLFELSLFEARLREGCFCDKLYGFSRLQRSRGSGWLPAEVVRGPCGRPKVVREVVRGEAKLFEVRRSCSRNCSRFRRSCSRVCSSF